MQETASCGELGGFCRTAPFSNCLYSCTTGGACLLSSLIWTVGVGGEVPVSTLHDTEGATPGNFTAMQQNWTAELASLE